MTRVLLILGVFAFLSVPAGAATKTVCGSGCDYSNLQTALTAVACGDRIEIANGTTWTGDFYLPNKSCAGPAYTTVTRSGALPAVCQVLVKSCRDNWVANFGSAPKIVRGVGGFAFVVNRSASYWKITGLEFSDPNTSLNGTGELIVLSECGSPCATTYNYGHILSELPDHIWIEQNYVHGTLTSGLQAGIVTTGTNIDVLNNYIDRIQHNGLESFGIYHQTEGPFHFQNNYISNAGIDIFIGDNNALITNSLPHDGLIEDNYQTKDCRWYINAAAVNCANAYDGFNWTVKNSGEMKRGRDVIWQHNVIENSWDQGQSGLVVLFQMYATPASGCLGCFMQNGSTGTGYLINHGGGYAGTYVGGPCPSTHTGSSTITVDTGTGTANVGDFLQFPISQTCGTTYKITASTGSPVTSMTIAPAIVESVADNEPFNVIAGSLDCTWCTLSNITFRKNVVRHGAIGMYAYGRVTCCDAISSPISDGLTIQDNLFYDISHSWSITDSEALDCIRPIGGWKNVTIDHNTCDNDGSTAAYLFTTAMTTDVPVSEYAVNFAAKNTFVRGNGYGFSCPAGSPIGCLNAIAPGPTWTWSHMVLSADTCCGGGLTYPATTTVISKASFDALFVDRAIGVSDDAVDYRLVPGSVYKAGGVSQADDGANVGVRDFSLLPDPSGGAVVAAPPVKLPVPLTIACASQPAPSGIATVGAVRVALCHDGQKVTAWGAMLDGQRQADAVDLRSDGQIYSDGLQQFTGLLTVSEGVHTVSIFPIYGPAGDGPASRPFSVVVRPRMSAPVNLRIN